MTMAARGTSAVSHARPRSGAHNRPWRKVVCDALLVSAALCVTYLASQGLFAADVLLGHWLVVLAVVPPQRLFGLCSLSGFVTVQVASGLLGGAQQRHRLPTRRRVLLVGAGEAGRRMVHELGSSPATRDLVVGVLDDDPAVQRKVLAGIRVVGTTDDAAAVALSLRADAFVLAMPSIDREQRRRVVRRCRAAGLPVWTVPGHNESGRGVRALRIEDLLGREVARLEAPARQAIRSAVAGKRILVTGAGGSIGSELCRQLAELQPERLVLVENNENNLFDIHAEMAARLGLAGVACLADIRDSEQMERIFARHRPQLVFHAAAYKHVPMMEHHPSAAVDNNVRGTRILSSIAAAFGVERFLLVSTDKAVNPANIMGASKRVAEMIVQAQDAHSRGAFCCVRFGNVLGSRGSVLHTFQRQIEAGGPVTVTHPEVTRFFMTIAEAVRLVIQAAAVGTGGEVFLLDMGAPVRIVELAREMIALAGARGEHVEVEFIGLRSGEKLYEELLRDEEHARPSSVPGMVLATLATVPAESLRVWVRRLELAADAHDEATIRKLLAIVAQYRPDTSARSPAYDILAPASALREAEQIALAG